MAAATSTVQVVVNQELADLLKDLMRREVLVGIPGDSPSRPVVPGEKTPPSNALIGYVQEFGDDERGTPARPFLMPGVEAAKDAIVKGLKRAAKGVLDGKLEALDAGLTQAGLAAETSVKNTILNGPFAPLAESTLKARARRKTAKGKPSQAETSKAARAELAARAAGADASTDARPLYDTHSLFNSITYVVRDKGKDR